MDQQYTLLQRVKYHIQRHAVGVVSILMALLALSTLGNIVWLEDNTHLALGGLMRVGIGVSLILLITKFAFPKLAIQEKIKDDPKAIAIFCGLIAVAVAQLF